jgi:hypothetical protein
MDWVGGCDTVVPGSSGVGVSDERSWVDAPQYWLSEIPAAIGTLLAVLFLAFGVLVIVVLIVGALVRAIL